MTHPQSQPGSARHPTVPVDAIVNLVNHQQQCDADGVMVQVSRQALAEVLVYVTEVRPDNKWADAALPRSDVQSAEQVAKIFAYIWHGDAGEWRGFLSKAEAFLSYSVPSAQSGCAIAVCTCRPGPCSFPSTHRGSDK